MLATVRMPEEALRSAEEVLFGCMLGAGLAAARCCTECTEFTEIRTITPGGEFCEFCAAFGGAGLEVSGPFDTSAAISGADEK
jgi:hypothetical protein